MNFINAKENATSLKEALNRVQETIKAIDDENIDNVSSQFLKMKEELIELRQQGLITDEQFKEMSTEYEGIISLANKASSLKAKRDEIDNRLNSGEQGFREDIRMQDIYAAADSGDFELA
jgi:cell fate (sporulation/competence/biofilm development) regulator YlbF (YheA/YmcA/DUF963 family)